MPRNNGSWTCSYTKVLSSPTFTTLISYGSYDIHDNIASLKNCGFLDTLFFVNFVSSLALRDQQVFRLFSQPCLVLNIGVFTACRLSKLLFFRRGDKLMLKYLIADPFPLKVYDSLPILCEAV